MHAAPRPLAIYAHRMPTAGSWICAGLLVFKSRHCTAERQSPVAVLPRVHVGPRLRQEAASAL